VANENDILARLKTQNVRGFVSDVGAASKSLLGFSAAAEEAKVKSRLTSIEALGLRQSLYTLRRYSFWATTAMFGTASAALAAGIRFDDVKEQATGAFEAALGSASAARREVNLLTADTHKTGIQLTDLAQQAETMQSFGFAIKDVNTDVLALANYAERAGRGVSTFEQIVEVFDRVRQNGRLTSLDLRSLTDQGIPALRIIADQLHLTRSQTAALQNNKLVIPAQYALPALAAGIGQIADQRGTTIDQQLGVTHSYVSQIFGTGEHGLFGFITKGLERVNGRLAVAARGQQSGGARGLLLGLDPSGTLEHGYQTLAGVVHSLGAAFGFAWKLAYPFRVLLVILGGATYGLATHTGVLTFALKAAAFWWVTSRSFMLAYEVGTRAVAAAMFVYRAAQVVSAVATLFFTDATFTATDALTALNLALLANPVTWIVIGIAALGVGMYLLVTRVHAVRDAFVWAFKEVKHAVRDVFNWIRDAWNLLTFHIPGFSVFGHHIGGFTLHVTPIGVLPGLADGGTLTASGDVVVGERGPEILRLPRAAQVTPLKAARGDVFGSLADKLQVISELHVDGQVISRLVAKHIEPVAEGVARFRAEAEGIA
jgi:hypothetical protein